MKALIIGAGIGGLSAAIALRQVGWDVELFEQAPVLEPMGAALSLWPNAVAALDILGCGDALRAVAHPITTFGLGEPDGRHLGRFHVADIIPGGSGFLPTRTQLQQLLLDRLGAVQLHCGERMAGMDERTDGVTVRMESGLEAAGDLLVAADGIWSRLGAEMTGSNARHAGYGGVLALSDPAHDHGETCTEVWGQGERLGVFDLAEGRKYWFYMKNEADPAESAATKLGFVRERVADWPDFVRAAVDATPETRIIPFSVHAKPPPKRLAKGRIACVGDAAHAMEPNMGQGACQALEDAVALGVAARLSSVDAVTSTYNRLRLARARQFVTLSAQGSLVPHRLPKPVATLSKAFMRRVFSTIAARQMRSLYTLPPYAARV